MLQRVTNSMMHGMLLSDMQSNLAKMLEQKGSGRGLISICAAGGQGVVAILER